jgi:alcohol dehydrogenase class IV
MEFKFFIPTKIFMGKQCIGKNASEFKDIGNNAIAVISKSSRNNRALADTIAALESEKISYIINDETEPNPSLNCVERIGSCARENNVDFVIGIGGGSALDIAKAVSVLAVNDIKAEQLYTNVFANKPLPLVTIPTTAGTGSEVTPYSVLTRLNTKKSFGTDSMFPVMAFLDATYTETLPHDITIDTAVDALSHAVEGYLTTESTPVSDLFALEIMRLFAKNIGALKSGNLIFQSREELLYAAMLSGIVIVHARTLAVHAMGYALTVFKGIPHGKSNGLLLESFLEFSYEYCKSKIDTLLGVMGLNSIKQFGAMINCLLMNNITITEKELKEFSFAVSSAVSAKPNPRRLTEENIYEIYIKSFHK